MTTETVLRLAKDIVVLHAAGRKIKIFLKLDLQLMQNNVTVKGSYKYDVENEIRMSSAILKAPVHPAVMKAGDNTQKQTDLSVKQTKI